MNVAVALTFLIIEAFALYLLVLGSHALRHRYGMSHFYATIGAITAIMSWVTEIGINVEYYGVTFFIGSTVFYTSLLLGVFIVYVFDGPRATRIVISTIIGVSILVPVVLTVMNYQMDLSDITSSDAVPSPALRINTASIIATFLDLMFLAMVWEYLGKPRFRMHLWLRTYVTLLGVMFLDVILFNTGAFLGSDDYLTIMKGTFSSRFIVSIISFPLLWSYISWQSTHTGVAIENRPVLSILQQKADVEHELSVAQDEIQKRKRVEEALRESEERINASLQEKELLLKEVHHRVKNNMQIISSLLDLQAGTYDDPKLQEMLSMSQRRIRAMGLIHEQLYTSENFGAIHAPDYIGNLAQYMSVISSTSSLLPDIRVDVDDMILSIDTAIPVGLIITEIMTNAIKYAFPVEWIEKATSNGSAMPDPVLTIELHMGSEECAKGGGDDHYILIVSDNGIGLPEDVDLDSPGTLGLQLVSMLTQQLKGTIEIDRTAGTRFHIVFSSRNSSTL